MCQNRHSYGVLFGVTYNSKLSYKVSKSALSNEITKVFGTLDQSVETFIAFEKSLSASINNVAICFVTHRGFVTAMLSFLLLIICTFVGKPYLLF